MFTSSVTYIDATLDTGLYVQGTGEDDTIPLRLLKLFDSRALIRSHIELCSLRAQYLKVVYQATALISKRVKRRNAGKCIVSLRNQLMKINEIGMHIMPY